MKMASPVAAATIVLSLSTPNGGISRWRCRKSGNGRGLFRTPRKNSWHCACLAIAASARRKVIEGGSHVTRHHVHGVVGFFEHALLVSLGFVLMVLGLGLGVTMIVLPAGVVIGLLGFAMFVGGFCSQGSTRSREREMIDRQKLETILSRRFPGGTHLEIAAAANAIMGLADEWEEVDPARRPADGASFDVSPTSSHHDAPDSRKGPRRAAE
jgi:hypothetical protein